MKLKPYDKHACIATTPEATRQLQDLRPSFHPSLPPSRHPSLHERGHTTHLEVQPDTYCCSGGACKRPRCGIFPGRHQKRKARRGDPDKPPLGTHYYLFLVVFFPKKRGHLTAGGCGWCSLGYGRLDYLRAMRKIARNGGGQQENGRPGECCR